MFPIGSGIENILAKHKLSHASPSYTKLSNKSILNLRGSDTSVNYGGFATNLITKNSKNKRD